MYAVGTPIPGTEGRACCVYFRPATSNDTQVLNIRYGNGCSASVSSREKKIVLQKNVCTVLDWIW